MGLYRWIDYRTLIFQPKMKQNKKYKDVPNIIFTYYFMIIDLQSGIRLTLKGNAILAFCGSYLSVNTDTDIHIVQPNGNNWSW